MFPGFIHDHGFGTLRPPPCRSSVHSPRACRVSPVSAGKRRLAGRCNPLIGDFTNRRTWKRSLRHLQLILLFHPPTPSTLRDWKRGSGGAVGVWGRRFQTLRTEIPLPVCADHQPAEGLMFTLYSFHLMSVMSDTPPPTPNVSSRFAPPLMK